MSEHLQPIENDAFLSLRHPLQPRRFALALFFALILFPLIAAGLVAGTVVVIVPLVALLLWMGGRVMFARFLGNSILVSELNYPRIYGIGEELKQAIGYKKKVNVFVYEQGHFNAYLMKFFFYRRAVFLNSELLEAGVTDDEVRWLIGRFVGYLRARRQAGFWGWTIRAAQVLLVFNIFLLPYERALVYTGDRIALAVIAGDLSSAISVMQKLFVGRQLGYSVNPNGIVDQHRLVKGSFFAFLARMFMAFPHMTARYVDLISFAKERYPAQYERFDAENPGLPADLGELIALPQAVVARATKDPVWLPLAAAVACLGLVALATVRVIVPRLSPVYSSSGSTLTPVAMDTLGTPNPIAVPPPADSTAVALPEPYVSTEGQFTVSFPGAPTQDTQQVALSGSDSVTLYKFQFADGNSSYLVTYNDYPAQYVPAEPQTFLKSLRDETSSSANGVLADDQPVDLHGFPGRVFKFTDKNGGSYTVLDVLHGQRLYQVIVTVGPGSSAPHAEDFVNSFRIL